MRRSPASRALLLLAGALLWSATGGCAYFNTFYHARKFCAQAEKIEKEAERTALNSGAAAAGNAASTATRTADLYNKCIQKCEKVIAEHPTSRWVDDAHFLMARAYYGKGDYVAARRELERLRTKLPNSNLIPDARFWSGLVQSADGDPEGARREWTALLEAFPKYDRREEVEFQLAETLRAQRRFEEAAAAYGAFVEKHPKGDRSTDARLSLGRMLLENKVYPEAQQAFEVVARRASDPVVRRDARLLLGEAYELGDERERALEIYSELAYDLDPDYLKGRMTREEREKIRAAEMEARAVAAADSALNARFLDPNDPNRRTAQTTPRDPNDPSTWTDANDPSRMQNPGQTGATPPTGFDAQGNPVGSGNPDGWKDPNDPDAWVDPNNPDVARNPQGQTRPPTSTSGPAATPNQGRQFNQNDPRYRELARVMLREGRVLSAMGRPWDAILVFEQVMAEFPRSEFAAEAQYRIGYAHEVLLEDYATAEDAYGKVAGLGRSSFTDDAARRARNLGTARRLNAALTDSTHTAAAAAADARFVRAELYLFQQEKPEKAVEEYTAIQTEMPGTEYAAKAALAEAWVRFAVLADTARGRAKYAEVMRVYADTEYGHQARRTLRGPDREPEERDFTGPTLDVLLTDENVASVARQDSTLYAALNPPPPPAPADTVAAGAATPGVPGGGLVAGIPGEPGERMLTTGVDSVAAPRFDLPSDPMAVPAGGPSPILGAEERARRAAAATTTVVPAAAPGDSSSVAPPDTTLAPRPEALRSLADIRREAARLSPEAVRAMLDSLNALQDSAAARGRDSTAAPADTAGEGDDR